MQVKIQNILCFFIRIFFFGVGGGGGGGWEGNYDFASLQTLKDHKIPEFMK